MSLRKSIFWIHLASGLLAGIFIAVMSITGIAIAFEEEILDFVDRDLSLLQEFNDEPANIDELIARLALERPEFKPTAYLIYRDQSKAHQIYQGRDQLLFADPYSFSFKPSQAHAAHEILHELEEWHRWLGVDDGPESIARLVVGIANFAFLILCLTGLYLWWPRRWNARMLRPALWIVKGRKGKAREYNWHNVFGFWSLLPLVIIVATGVVISFGWAHDLVFRIAGETPPPFRDFRMMLVQPPALKAIEPPADFLTYQEIHDKIAAQFPHREAIAINFPRKSSKEGTTAPVSVDVYQPALFSTKGYTPLSVDPYTGEILQQTSFSDRSPGLQARVWIRFLHTGAAFGLLGKVVAVIATAASLVLVYTGFALAYRRFSQNRKTL